jgi:hypothetical protein
MILIGVGISQIKEYIKERPHTECQFKALGKALVFNVSVWQSCCCRNAGGSGFIATFILHFNGTKLPY